MTRTLYSEEEWNLVVKLQTDRAEKAEAEVERLREAIGDLVAASCDARDLPPGWSIVPTNTIEALRGDAS